MRIESPYNPLAKKNLGISIQDALLERGVEPLPPSEPFLGAGIYAIYYLGDFPAYAPLAAANSKEVSAPIYVGKAVPAGARKGGFGLDSAPGKDLYKRLRQHAESIKEVTNLRSEDFRCRFLAVDDIWIPLGENLLIETFHPLWNTLVDGFGNHNPGKGRHAGRLPAWDVLHPGRSWAGNCQPNDKSTEEILADVAEFFAVAG
jgi:hypothetical protein